MKRWKQFTCCVFLMLLVLPVQVDAYPAKKLAVHFLDVGQGDSILIQTPTGKHILIDGGPPEAGKTVVNYLKALEIDKIDLLIATHPDIDHIGGLPAVMQAFPVKLLMDSGKVHGTKTYMRYLQQIRKKQIPMMLARKNQSIDIDPLMDLQVLNTSSKHKSNNQSSIVLKLSFGKHDLLFMSDIEQKQEKELLSQYDVQADLIKVAHHGSKTSSSKVFLEEVDANVAILTYSKDNDYGHPVERVIKRLLQLDTHIYSTAVFGHIIFQTDGQNFLIFPEKGPLDALNEKTG